MPVVVRIAIGVAVVSALMFSYGMLYIRGRVGKRLAVLVGGAIGLAGALVAIPNFEYVGAAVATIVILVVIGAVVYPLTVGMMDSTRDRLMGTSYGSDDGAEPPPPSES